MEIDFASGRNHRDLLIMLLENFIVLALEPPRMETSAKVQEYATRLIQHAAQPLTVELLLTGSVAENVCSVYIAPSEFDVSVLYSPEYDTMAVIDINRLLGGSLTYNIVVTNNVNANPCFVKIQLSAAEQKSTEQKDDNGGLLLMFSQYLSDGVNYLSPHLFIKHIRERMILSSTFVAKRHPFLTYDVFEHGPAVRVREIREFEQFSYYPKLTNPYSFQEDRRVNESDVDIVPALQLPKWPEVARGWITRHRRWPGQELVDNIVQSGIMVVCKPPSGRNNLMDWRLSFSRAEVMLLSDTELPCKQQAHRVFKYIVKHIIAPPSVLNSYHCKSVTLWACERHPPSYWSWENFSHCVLGLLDDMIYCIAARRCPHYFLPEVNLFETIPEEFLSTTGQRLAHIRRDPINQLPPISTETPKILSQEVKLEHKTRCSDAIETMLQTLRSNDNLKHFSTPAAGDVKD